MADKVADKVLVFYGSYRADRMGIRLADYLVSGLKARGSEVELIDAKAIDLPMLDKRYSDYAPGEARTADYRSRAPAPLASPNGASEALPNDRLSLADAILEPPHG